MPDRSDGLGPGLGAGQGRTGDRRVDHRRYDRGSHCPVHSSRCRPASTRPRAALTHSSRSRNRQPDVGGQPVQAQQVDLGTGQTDRARPVEDRVTQTGQPAQGQGEHLGLGVALPLRAGLAGRSQGGEPADHHVGAWRRSTVPSGSRTASPVSAAYRGAGSTAYRPAARPVDDQGRGQVLVVGQHDPAAPSTTQQGGQGHRCHVVPMGQDRDRRRNHGGSSLLSSAEGCRRPAWPGPIRTPSAPGARSASARPPPTPAAAVPRR